MISFLSGTVLETSPESIVLDVQGVGYEVETPASTLCHLGQTSSLLSLHILTHVREDAIRLFGFINALDKAVFKELLSVNGIGPKAALALLGPMDGAELCQIITQGQAARLTTIPGIGPKTADRIVLELKTKLQKRVQRFESSTIAQTHAHTASLLIIEDLKSALNNLGYKEKQFSEILQDMDKRLQKGESLSLEKALKESLRRLSQHIWQ
jgi:holliday junction DNA helicase RuvA